MALIRHAYGFDDVPLIDDWIRKAPGFEDVFQTFPVSGADKEKDDHLRKTKSQIIRLSNVVLKREWEQVKHAK